MTQGRTVSLRQIYRCQVLNQKQELVGTVDDVLFHPTRPRAVGFSVKPFRLAGIVALPTKYLLFENAQFNSEGQLTVVLDGEAPADEKQQRKAKVAWDARAEKQLVKWRSTSVAAAKQSRRAWFPEVTDVARTADVVGLLEQCSVPVVLHEAASGPIGELPLGDQRGGQRGRGAGVECEGAKEAFSDAGVG